MHVEQIKRETRNKKILVALNGRQAILVPASTAAATLDGDDDKKNILPTLGLSGLWKDLVGSWSLSWEVHKWCYRILIGAILLVWRIFLFISLFHLGFCEDLIRMGRIQEVLGNFNKSNDIRLIDLSLLFESLRFVSIFSS